LVSLEVVVAVVQHWIFGCGKRRRAVPASALWSSSFLILPKAVLIATTTSSLDGTKLSIVFL
jgi:hypothetical protein